MSTLHIVTYEDRPYDVTGLKLLLLSLQKHVSGTKVDVIFPAAPDAIVSWTSRFPDVSLHTGTDLKRGGYNVKPSVLLQALEKADNALWLDTDIIVTRDFRDMLSKVSSDSLVTTEEWFGAPFQGGSYRSRAWGYEVGRRLPATTNSCVVRVTPRHRALLQEWDKVLEEEAYVAAQKMHWAERPIHLQSDQEVLAALLESKRYTDIPIRYLKRGRDVAHCFQHQGYMAHQMIANLLTGNRPYFVHGQGAKPWRSDDTFRYYLDVSTYTLSAMEFRRELGEDTHWLNPKTRSGRYARTLFRNSPWLTAFPLAVYEEARNQRVLKTALKQVLRRA